jgi:hypothetical protein
VIWIASTADCQKMIWEGATLVFPVVEEQTI